MQLAHFGLLIAILALKRPYLTLDVWVQRSSHEIGSSAAVWAVNRFNAAAFHGGGFLLPPEPVTHLGESGLRAVPTECPPRWLPAPPLPSPTADI